MVKPWQEKKLVENFQSYMEYVGDLDYSRDRVTALNLYNLTELGVREALGLMGESTMIKMMHENQRIARELDIAKKTIEILTEQKEEKDE